ncbi:acetyl-CoA synthetase-like protein [Hortaea werneckii]|nr:acetyl-CoA synthetase-like protein [Hortaea werneckii]
MSCGERTILATIGDIAKTTPDREWTTYAQSRECFERGQLRTVTFAELANAIDRLAWHLDEALSSRRDKETVGYIGPNDVSERQADPTLSKLVDEGTVQVIDIPAIETLLSSHPVQTFPYEADFRTCLNDAFIILHTSGSTGLPKPVEITHGLIATIDAQQLLPDVDGRHTAAREWAHRSVYTALPPFHSAGFNFFSFSVFQSTHLVMGPADQPPSLDTVEQILNIGCASAAVIPPSLLAEVAADEKLLPRLSEWSSVAFGGGPLPRDAGDAIWKHTKILQCLGSTETFNVPELVPRSIDEWPYHDFHPDLCISFMERQQGLHELVFIRNESSLKHQGAFWTFPELNEYPMKDLYEQHPSKPSMWAYRGRVDDVVVLSNGEKIMPKDAENAIASDENVRAALIVGNGQAQPGLLVEPKDELSAAGGQNDGEGGGQEDIHAHMNFLLQTYSSRLNGIGTDRPTAVVLTGSTGSLGSYILDNLLRNPKVDKVFCLNRSSNAMEKQRQNNESRGLTQDFSKADFLQVNLAQFELNLDKQKYTMLRTQATHIIHNAWPVDFNMSLSTFEPQLEGCLRLIELACTAPVKPEMMFLSSVGAANNWCSISSTPVPEESLQDFNAAESMGYAQSKLLAEQIFDRASAKHDVPVKTCRVGQITGPVNSEKGMWSTNEWLPSMLLSCKALRAIPESLGSMDAMAWIPCDLLSTMLVDTILVGPSKWTSNEPASGSWPDIPIDEPESDSSVGSRSPSECLSSSKDTASSHEKADVVSLPQWVDALARVADSEDNISQIPAVRLLEFFRGIASEEAQKPVFSTSRSTAHCKMLRDLPPVSVPWFKQWLKQWEKGGALT